MQGVPEFIWPSLHNQKSIDHAVMQGEVAAGIFAIIALLAAIYTGNTSALGLSIFYALIGYCIFRYSRIAAILMAIFVVTDIVFGRDDILRILLAFMLLNAVRGTFAFHSKKDKEHAK